MKERDGAAKMGRKAQRILEKIVEQLAWSARAVAWHEGQGWEPEMPGRRPDRRKLDY